MRFQRVFQTVVFIFAVCLSVREVSAVDDNNAQAVALLQKVTDAYKNAPSFSCEGKYEDNLQTAQSVDLMGNFKILFSRPDYLRVDWTEVMTGGKVFTNSIFTKDNGLFFYWDRKAKWAPQKNMGYAMAINSGNSHRISYEIPSLLLGEGGYNFVSLKPPTNAVVDGVHCVVLAGTTKFLGDMEIAVDPTSYAIHQIKTTTRIVPKEVALEIDNNRKEEAQTSPGSTAKLKHFALPNGPVFTSVQVTTYKNPVFGKKLVAGDFVYPVPGTAKRVDNILK